MNYSYINNYEEYDKTRYIKNAGLYSGTDINHKRIQPESLEYTKDFFAPHHIPTNIRPGNNEPDLSIFNYYNSKLYNFKCLNSQ